MQDKFSRRDGVLYTVLVILTILLLLLMYQMDRQWTMFNSKLGAMQTALNEQISTLRNLRNQTGVQAANINTLPDSAMTTHDTTHSNPITPSVKSNDNSVASGFERAWLATLKPDYAMGDWRVNSFGNTLKTLTPLVSSDAYASDVQSYVFESLLKRDPDTLSWEGFIAKSWQVSEDGLTITFQLRDDVNFSDGTPLTAEDVAFSFKFIMTDAIDASRSRSYFEKVASVNAKDKYMVEFIFKEPYFEALALAGGMDILPKHFYEPYLTTPQVFNESKALLLGSGPYRLADQKAWSPAQDNIELVRNEQYWGDVQPTYQRLLWRIIQNDSARLTTYRNGDIDSYDATAKEYKTLKDDPQIMAKSGRFEYMPPVAGYSYIAWNELKGGKATWFADKRVRQAMTYLTDRERIIKDIQLGYAEIAVSPFSASSKQHNPDLMPYSYSVEKAKALLAEAGFSDKNKDGVLENASGESFEFKLIYFQDNEDTKRMVLLLKDLYAVAGIKLIPSPQEWPVMLEALDKKDFDAITLGWTSSIETDIYQIFHSSQAKTKGDDFISYINPELDKLIDQARSTVDETKRMPIWQQAERILHEDQPYTFLFRRDALRFIDKRIHNLKMTKLGLNDGVLPIETYVPSAMQRYH